MLPPLSSVKNYERRKKQKIEKIRKFFLTATKRQQTRMAAAIYHYTNEYDSCEFLSAAPGGKREKKK